MIMLQTLKYHIPLKIGLTEDRANRSETIADTGFTTMTSNTLSVPVLTMVMLENMPKTEC